MTSAEASATPEGISSLLDTDLYKLTMQCALRAFYPEVPATYRLRNRTAHMKLSNDAFTWLQTQVSKLSALAITPAELAWLKTTCKYLNHKDYLTDFLPKFRFDPASQVTLSFKPDTERPGYGDVEIGIHGLWQDTILYEIPLLALVSEAYFRFVDTDWDYDGQEQRAYEKGVALLKGGAIFSEFGTRRRRDYKTQRLVMDGLKRASQELQGQDGITGKLSGTSNVHFAMTCGVQPVGTMAHEWFMGIAAATQDYKNATATGLNNWTECFGRRTLAIALTDTFGTPVFLETFRQQLPAQLQASGADRTDDELYANAFVGVRQDSGDPKKFIKMLANFYATVKSTEKKAIVFSDSLTVDRALLYKRLAEKRGFAPSFGIGTFFTNDYNSKSKPEEKSKPMNIVIKIASAGGNPAIKLSDDLGKNTGDQELVERVKKELGYVDEHWSGADEADRYGKGVMGADLEDSEDDAEA